jgi:hypothetical protein
MAVRFECFSLLHGFRMLHLTYYCPAQQMNRLLIIFSEYIQFILEVQIAVLSVVSNQLTFDTNTGKHY